MMQDEIQENIASCDALCEDMYFSITLLSMEAILTHFLVVRRTSLDQRIRKCYPYIQLETVLVRIPVINKISAQY